MHRNSKPTLAFPLKPDNHGQGSPIPSLHRRRLFLKTTAIAASLVAVSIVGFDRFRNTAESVAPTTVQAQIAADFATLDAAYASFGRSKIEGFIASRNDTIVIRTYRWIEDRGHVGMYDLVVSGLTDHREEVAYYAVSVLQSIAPVDLKPLQAQISLSMRLTPHTHLGGPLTELLQIIESS